MRARRRAILGLFSGVLAILGTALSATALPTLAELQARPAYFSPDGNGQRDSTQVTCLPGGAPDSVTVSMAAFALPGGGLQDTVLPPTLVPASEPLAVDWKPTPASIADGSYRIDVTVDDGFGTVTESVTVTVDRQKPTVSLGAVGPNPFNASVDLSVPYDIVGADATTRIRVRTAVDTVRTIATVLGSATGTATWNGRRADSMLVVTASYVIEAVASDLAGNADTATAIVLLDRTPPAFHFTPSESLQTDQPTVLVSGLTTDNDVVSSLSYSVNAGSSYVAVDSSGAPADSVAWQTLVTLPVLSTTVRSLIRFRAEDDAGNRADTTVIVAYALQLPEPVSSSVVGGGSVRDGEPLQIRSVWNLPGLKLTANFLPLDTGYSTQRPAARETVTEGPPGTYLIDYRVTPSNTRTSGTYNVILRAEVGFVAVRDTVAVTLDALGGPRGSELARVSANRFDPRAGEIVSVSARATGAAVSVEIFDLSGQRVRALSGTGFVEWNGRGEAGQAVASGVYVLRVEVDGEEEVRKVAVLRGGGS